MVVASLPPCLWLCRQTFTWTRRRVRPPVRSPDACLCPKLTPSSPFHSVRLAGGLVIRLEVTRCYTHTHLRCVVFKQRNPRLLNPGWLWWVNMTKVMAAIMQTHTHTRMLKHVDIELSMMLKLLVFKNNRPDDNILIKLGQQGWPEGLGWWSCEGFSACRVLSPSMQSHISRAPQTAFCITRLLWTKYSPLYLFCF